MAANVEPSPIDPRRLEPLIGREQRLATNARRHIQTYFLGDRHLLQYAELLAELIGDR